MSDPRARRRASVRLAWFLAMVSPVFAQEFRATLGGRITDMSGAVVPGAAVTAINEETNAAVRAASNEAGNYRIPLLLPGDYRIVVELARFKKIERTGVRLSIGSDTSLDFTLEMGETTQTITVTEAAPLVNASNADLGQVVESREILMATPVVTRNVMNRISLVPGVTTEPLDAQATDATYTSNAQSSISISGGGGQRGGNEILVDGIPNTVARSGGIALFVPSLDLVQEMKVHTTMFDASMGRSNGGVINITTRGGANKFHGAVYDYKRWRAIDANMWQNNRLSQPKPPVNYYQYGGILGGPVRIPRVYNGKDRTFFMLSYEADSSKQDRPFEARLPTDLERKGDFSQTINLVGTGLVQIYDPWTTTGTGTTARRTVFPGGIIPSSRLSPIGLAVARLYPLPSRPGAARIAQYNYAADPVGEISQKQYSARVDHNMGARQRMFVRLSRLDRGQAPIALPFPYVYSAPVVGTAPFGNSPRTFDSAAVDHSATLSPSLVGSFRYGFVERSAPQFNPKDPPDPAMLGLPAAILANQAVVGFPQFNLGENFPSFGTGLRLQRWFSHNFLGTLYKISGNHSLKAGGDYRLTRAHTNDPGGSAAGTFTFSPVFTQSNPFVNTASDTSGSGLASLLLAVPASGSLGFTSPTSVQNHYLAFFVQDSWKVRRKLTLTVGLRYEVETPYTERYNRAAYGYDFNAAPPLAVPGVNFRGGLLFAGVNGNPRRQGNLDRNNLGPRFGFAYSLNDKTVLRGGYGIFYGAQAYQTDFLGAVGTFNSVTNYTGTIDNGATPYTTLANPFPTGVRKPRGSEAGLAAQYGDTLTVFDQNRVNPYNEQWQISLQRALPGQMVVEAAYVGMLSLKEMQSFNLNEKPDPYLALGTAENNRLTNPFLGIFDPTSTLGAGATITQGQLWKRYPQYGTLALEGANTGRATYHALQAKVEKRLQHGFSMLFAHTYSKLIMNNTTSLVNERHYRAVSPLDRTHVMRLTVVYDLPFGLGQPLLGSRKGAIARLVEAWSMSAVISSDSGSPLTVTQTNGRPVALRNPSLDTSVSGRIGDAVDPVTKKVLNPFFDTAAFAALPNQYTISPTSPYFSWLRGPRRTSLNVSLVKSVTIAEQIKFQVRADASNLLNSPIWDNPGTNMSSPTTFGVISSTSSARKILIGARISF